MLRLSKKVISSMLAALLLTTSVFGNDVTAQALVSSKAETATAVKVDSDEVAANNYGLVGVKEGNILHAWDWKFTDVTKNIKDIAEAGYSIVQVSPCQVCENANNNNDWWKLYQPYDYKFGNSLGSADEFKEMCKTAEEYGISIVVDVVANHVAGTGTGNCGERKPEVDSWWTDDKFHNTNVKFTGKYDNDREMMVTSNIGMPDVDTSRDDVQKRMIAYLETMLDMGADGFRYDAAKHIGTTSDTGKSQDTFWKNISAAVSAKRPDALVYGEILNGMPVSDEYYVKDGIKVTESQKGWDMKDALQKSLSGAAGEKTAQQVAFTYTRKASASNLITWVENHDTYLNHWGSTGLQGNANYMSDDQIILGWSTVAARADAQALFFARPDGCSNPKNPDDPDASNTIAGTLGISTKNFIWKDKRVAAVNKFKNAMVGEKEDCSANGNVAVIKRGNKGVVATNFGSDSANFSVSGLSGLKDGTYEDASGQNGSFKVSGGSVSGSIKGNTFVVLYDADSTVIETEAPSTEPPKTEAPGQTAQIKVSKESGSFEKALDVSIDVKNAVYAYCSNDGAQWTEIKDDKATVSVGSDAKLNGDAFALYVKAKGLDGKVVDQTYTYTFTTGTVVDEPVVEGLKIRTKASDFTEAPSMYVYTAEDPAIKLAGEWPGTKMVKEGDYYVFEDKKIDEKNKNSASMLAIINDGKENAEWQVPSQDSDSGFKVSGYMEFDKTSGKMTKVQGEPVTPTADPNAKKANVAPEFTEPVDTTDIPAPATDTPAPATDTPAPVTESPAPATEVPAPVIHSSMEDGSSFYTETADVELSFENTASVSFSVDNGPMQNVPVDANNKTVKATLGLGKIADTNVTLYVKATGADNKTTEKTFTYKKVFVKKAAAVKTMSAFANVVMDKFTEEAERVDSGLSGAPGSSHYATNPNKQVGSKKTITSASDFTEDMIIAQGVANDDARTFKGTHEYPVLDMYAMYGAWDDNNIYIGIQYVNTTDVNDPAQDGASSDSAKPIWAEIPQAIYFDLGSGDYTDGSTSDGAGTTIWNLNTTFEGSAKVDAALVYAASLTKYDNLGFYKSVGGAFDYDTGVFTKGAGAVTFASTGIKQTFEDTFIGKEMWGIKGTGYTGYTPEDLNSDSSNWVDFLKEGHKTSLDTFMTFTIPYEFLGITKEDVESKGIGIMQTSTFGASGIESLPMDMTMLDNATEEYSYGDNTTAEKEDKDVVTVALARLGNGNVPAPIPSAKPTPTAPASPTPSAGVETTAPAEPTPSASVETTAPAEPTASADVPSAEPTPSAGVETTAPAPGTDAPVATAPVSDETAYCVNFGADKSAPQYDTTDLTLSAVVYNGTAPYNYTFYVDGTEVQNSAAAVYKWSGAAGNHTIKVVVKDAAGRMIESEKNYILTESGNATVQPPVTTTEPPVVTTVPPTVPVSSVPAVSTPPAETSVPTATIPSVTVPPSANPGDGNTTGTQKEGLVIKSFSTDPISKQKLGGTITLKTEVAGGTGKIKYTYLVANAENTDNVEIIALDSEASTAVWGPEEAGTYILYAMVSDENNDDDYAALNYTITTDTKPTAKPKPTVKPLKVKSLKVTTAKKKRVVKKKISLKAAVSNKSGTVKYKFYIKKKGAKKKTLVRKYSTKNTASFKVKKSGTYYVYVYAKDKRNKVVSKKVKITVKKAKTKNSKKK